MDFLFSLVSNLIRLVLRLLLLAMGLAFATALLCVLLTFVAIWILRALWSRLTGQPVTPWVMRVDPRAGWSRFAQRGRAAPSAGDTVQEASRRFPAHHADVVDVDVKERQSP